MHEKMKQMVKRSSHHFLLVAFGIGFYFVLLNLNTFLDLFQTVLRLARPLILAIAMAYVINLPMKKIETWLKKRIQPGHFLYKRIRTIATFSALLFVLLVIVLLFMIIVPQLIDSIGLLFSNMGNYISNIITMILNLLDSLHLDNEYITQELNNIQNIPWDQVINELLKWLGSASNSLGSVASSIVNQTISFTGELGNCLAAFMISLYLLSGKETLLYQVRKMMVAFTGQTVSKKLFAIATQANTIFSSFIGGQLVEAFILFCIYYVGMSLFKMPYPLLISTIIGITSIIPVFGAMLGVAIGCVLILAIHPIQVIWFYIFYQVLQILDNNLIYPYVVGNSVGLPGVWVMLSILVFGGLFGVVGMFIAVPTSTLCYQLIGEFTNYCLSKRKLKVEMDGSVLENKESSE